MCIFSQDLNDTSLCMRNHQDLKTLHLLFLDAVGQLGRSGLVGRFWLDWDAPVFFFAA